MINNLNLIGGALKDLDRANCKNGIFIIFLFAPVLFCLNNVNG